MFLLSNNCKRKTHIFNVNAFTSLTQLSNYLMRQCLCLNTRNSRASQHPIVSNILTRYCSINCLVYHHKNPTNFNKNRHDHHHIPGTLNNNLLRLFQLEDSKSLHGKWLEITKHPLCTGCFGVPDVYNIYGCFQKEWYPKIDGL